MKLSESDIRLIKRAKESESRKWAVLILNVTVGIGFVALYWHTPFAFGEFYQATAGNSGNTNFHDARYITMWFLGILFIFRGVSDLFESRDRKLLIKLYENQLRNTAEQGAAANP